MITLKIGAQKIDFYNEISVTLQYDAVASTFGVSFYFDPNNARHREIFRPATYKRVTLEQDGELLITGTLLGFSAGKGAQRNLIQVNGYTTTGVLGDCEIPTSVYPLQTNGLNLKQIAERVLKPFGLNVVVDQSVLSECSTKYPNVVAKNAQTVQDFLHELAAQKHVMLSHDEKGNLLLTRPSPTAVPLYHFDTTDPGSIAYSVVSGKRAVEITLEFDGQRMHSGVTLIKQQSKGRKDGTHKKGNAGRATYDNPFVPSGVVRPRVARQTNGQTVDTANAARNLLSEELKGVQLTVRLDRWDINGKIVRPNNIITVTAPDLFLFKPTRFFIAQVDFAGDNESQTSVLTCFLPSVFGAEAPVNIFA